MRQIVCLRVECAEYTDVYRAVGELMAVEKPCEKIEVCYSDLDESGAELLCAEVSFANGTTRVFPIGPGISWDLAPEEKT